MEVKKIIVMNYDTNQLSDVIKKIGKIKVDYWVDSGTLLGLVREGCLLDGDNDIDIGVWSEDEKKILLAFDLYFKDDYSLKKYYFKNKIFKLKFIPICAEKRKIDICLFNRYRGFAWCFQSLFFRKKNKPFYYLMAIIEHVFTAKYINNSSNLFYGKYPLLLFRRPGFWKVPLQHFENTENFNFQGIDIKTPSDTDKYLSLRYGDWRSAKSNWNFMTDDGLLIRKFPNKLLEKL